MRLALLGLAAALNFGSLAQAQAPAPAAAAAVAVAVAAAPAYSSASKVGALLDNPAAKAVLLAIIPGVVNHPQINDARDMTLLDLAQYAPELTPDVYGKIHAELAKLPQA